MSIARDDTARKIPFDVRWILNRTHIGTPYEDVAADIHRRLVENNTDAVLRDGFRRARAKLITDALIQHRRNRQDYAWIMGSH